MQDKCKYKVILTKQLEILHILFSMSGVPDFNEYQRTMTPQKKGQRIIL